MKILVTNDDGIYAPGLWALYRQFSRKHEVTVVAPDRERSAVGHGITLHEPLRACRISVNEGCTGYAVNGKPADCVKLGLQELVRSRPDMVISGINPGANVGININYSGTVAAAREAALCGIPAIAVSIEGPLVKDYNEAACFTEKLACDILERGLPFGTLLNVNLPNLPLERTAGVCISRQNVRKPARDMYEKRLDPRNRPYHWLGLEPPDFGQDMELDGDALAGNYITITPIKCDMTDYTAIEDLKSWGICNMGCGKTDVD